MKPTVPDPVIDELRDVRHRISASCEHDPAKLVASLVQFQVQFRDRLTYIPVEVPAEPDALQTIPPETNQAAATHLATPVLKT